MPWGQRYPITLRVFRRSLGLCDAPSSASNGMVRVSKWSHKCLSQFTETGASTSMDPSDSSLWQRESNHPQWPAVMNRREHLCTTLAATRVDVWVLTVLPGLGPRNSLTSSCSSLMSSCSASSAKSSPTRLNSSSSSAMCPEFAALASPGALSTCNFLMRSGLNALRHMGQLLGCVDRRQLHSAI